MPDAPSGEQYEILSGEQHATIVEVGGGIRSYTHGEREVLQGYAREAVCDGAHGAVLVPWPNRLADGRYDFAGVEHQLALSEPATGSAIHGLLRWTPWHALRHDAASVLMGTRLHPQPGYPFDLDVTVDYSLAGDGLTVTTSARNVGADICPFGAGQHPYLSPGGGTLDRCILELAAETVLTPDARGLPAGRHDVAGGELDFRVARPIAATVIDAPFTDLQRDAEGRARVRLTAPDGSCVELWADARHPVLQVFTGDTLTPPRRRTALAVEPMTCPPNALRSGEDLIVLEPGESVALQWGAVLLRRSQ